MRRGGALALLALLAALAACGGSPGHAAPASATDRIRIEPAPATVPAPTSTISHVSTSATAVATSERQQPVVRRAFPLQDAANAAFADEHHDYPAADIFHPGGCGATIVSPVDGVVLESNPSDHWDAAVDDPATRGGIFLSVLGDDGVRYYLAHFQSLAAGIDAGVRLSAGQVVGAMGSTGRAGACHLHFALSPPCPNAEWWVRRGVVWPQAFLRDWQAGGQRSPAGDVATWSAANPAACSTPPATA